MLEVAVISAKSWLTQSEFDTLLPLVSLEKRERIKKFRFFRDAQNCLLGDVLARIEICRFARLDNKQLVFATNAFGKPFLVSNPSVHFNISHAGYYVACAVADEPIGIDIEHIRPVDLKIVERFFSPDEAAYIASGKQLTLFYEVWTKKESQIKWDGKGLHKPLSSFNVLDSNAREGAIYYKVFQNDEAICHVCSIKQAMPSVKVIDVATFMQSITQL